MAPRDERLPKLTRDHGPTAVFVAVCFAFFLGLVHFTFPEGMSLRGLVRPGSTSPWGSSPDEVELTDSRRTELAKLIRIVRKVKDKPSDDIAWHEARVGMLLGTRHSIQTHEHSSATIAFDGESSLILGENSLIVLRSYDGEENGSDRRANLVVFGGELRGTLASGGEGGVRVRVETPRGDASLESPDEGEGPATFQVRVREDSSTTVSVYSGKARIRSGEKTVEVAPNQSVRLDRAGAVSLPAALPSAPKPLEPTPRRTFPFRLDAPNIRFEWGRAENADEYRFVVASDPDLEIVVYETLSETAEVTVEGLDPGTYYWSVAGRRDGIEGVPSPAQPFTLARDEEPPALEVEWPEGAVSEKTVRLAGLTEPGAHVFVSNEPAQVEASGRFFAEVELSRGANNVVVEAIDDAGNSSYQTRMIKALY